MATQFTSFNFKKNGPQYLKDNINIALICKDVLKSDTYAQTLAKAVGQTPMTGPDVSITVSGDDAMTIINAKSGIDPGSTATAGNDLCIAYCSAGVEVIAVVDAQDRIVVNGTGDTIDLPAGKITSKELTSVAA